MGRDLCVGLFLVAMAVADPVAVEFVVQDGVFKRLFPSASSLVSPLVWLLELRCSLPLSDLYLFCSILSSYFTIFFPFTEH